MIRPENMLRSPTPWTGKIAGAGVELTDANGRPIGTLTGMFDKSNAMFVLDRVNRTRAVKNVINAEQSDFLVDSRPVDG